MIFDVEFVVADARPLCGKENQLLPFLAPLHYDNNTIRINSKKKPYYRFIGPLNTWKPLPRTFFKAKNAVKFTLFEKHKIQIESLKASIFRKNHIRRYFSTSYYGAVNYLKIGFEFNLIQSKSNINDLNGRVLFEFLKFIFITKVKVNERKSEKEIGKKAKASRERVEKEIGEIDNWLCEIVNENTSCNKKKKCNPEAKIKPVGIVAILEYNEKEITSLPRETKKEYSDESLEINSYDFIIRDLAKTAKIFFIKKTASCDETYLHEIKSKLFLVRSNFLCLDYIIDKISLTNQQQYDYIKLIEKNEMDILNGNFRFMLSSQSNVIDVSRLTYIKDRIRDLKVINGLE